MKTLGLILAIISMAFTGEKVQAFGQTTGLEIMEKVYHLPTGDDMEGELTMTLTNARGEERVRNLRQFSKKDSKVEKKIMFFLAPADVRNTSFMNWSYTDGSNDDQWIYLPALKRTRRISSDSKSDYFMGSDFTYDDLGDRHPIEDEHTLLREEIINGYECYVVESVPKDDSYIYSKTITWVIKDVYVGLKREFYDRDGKLLKELNIKSFDKIDGFWTILETEMKNVQRNHSTTMRFENIKYNQGISDSRFTERSMTMGI